MKSRCSDCKQEVSEIKKLYDDYVHEYKDREYDLAKMITHGCEACCGYLFEMATGPAAASSQANDEMATPPAGSNIPDQPSTSKDASVDEESVPEKIPEPITHVEEAGISKDGGDGADVAGGEGTLIVPESDLPETPPVAPTAEAAFEATDRAIICASPAASAETSGVLCVTKTPAEATLEAALYQNDQMRATLLAIAKSQPQVSDLTRQLDELKARETERSTREAELQRENNKLTSRNLVLEGQLTQLEATHKAVESELKKLKAAHKSLETNHESLEEQHSQLKSQHDDRLKRVSILKS